MKLLLSAATVYLACVAGAACAGGPTDKDAIAMAERGAASIKAKGMEEAIKRIQAHDPAFLQDALSMNARELYTGIVLADSSDPTLAGKLLPEAAEAGSTYPRQVLEMAQNAGKGWIATPYRDPAGGKPGMKTAYVLKVDDVVLQAVIRQQ